jgi:uncharacterized protein YaaN involved in tellurite resistance
MTCRILGSLCHPFEVAFTKVQETCSYVVKSIFFTVAKVSQAVAGFFASFNPAYRKEALSLRGRVKELEEENTSLKQGKENVLGVMKKLQEKFKASQGEVKQLQAEGKQLKEKTAQAAEFEFLATTRLNYINDLEKRVKECQHDARAGIKLEDKVVQTE